MITSRQVYEVLLRYARAGRTNLRATASTTLRHWLEDYRAVYPTLEAREATARAIAQSIHVDFDVDRFRREDEILQLWIRELLARNVPVLNLPAAQAYAIMTSHLEAREVEIMAVVDAVRRQLQTQYRWTRR